MALQRTGKKQIDMQNRKGKKEKKSQRMKKRKMGWPAAFRQFRTAVKTSSCPQPWAIAMSCERIGKKHVDMQKKERQKGEKSQSSERRKKRTIGWAGAFRQFLTSGPQPWAIAMPCEELEKSTSTCKKGKKAKEGKRGK